MGLGWREERGGEERGERGGERSVKKKKFFFKKNY